MDASSVPQEDEAMADFDLRTSRFLGPGGVLDVPRDDEITRKLAMLVEGECTRAGPKAAAERFGFSRQRYFQLRAVFLERGSLGLHSERRGPKGNYRRSREAVCQAIRHRLLDPEASSAVIAQKMRQCGLRISKRSVDRIFADFGLQKKTLSVPARPHADPD
jgi:transposase